MRDAVNLKEQFYLAFLVCVDWQAKENASLVVTESKTSAWEEFSVSVGKDFKKIQVYHPTTIHPHYVSWGLRHC